MYVTLFSTYCTERSLGLEFGQIHVKITTQNSHFSKFKYIHLPSCITSIPITLFTLVIQLRKSVEKNLAYYGLLNFWNKPFMLH